MASRSRFRPDVDSVPRDEGASHNSILITNTKIASVGTTSLSEPSDDTQYPANEFRDDEQTAF